MQEEADNVVKEVVDQFACRVVRLFRSTWFMTKLFLLLFLAPSKVFFGLIIGFFMVILVVWQYASKILMAPLNLGPSPMIYGWYPLICEDLLWWCSIWWWPAHHSTIPPLNPSPLCIGAASKTLFLQQQDSLIPFVSPIIISYSFFDHFIKVVVSIRQERRPQVLPLHINIKFLFYVLPYKISFLLESPLAKRKHLTKYLLLACKILFIRVVVLELSFAFHNIDVTQFSVFVFCKCFLHRNILFLYSQLFFLSVHWWTCNACWIST